MLDEPTAVLTPQEALELFDVLRELRDRGTAIILITHKLDEVLEIADRVSVLRRGVKVATIPAAGATERGLAELMVGREVLLEVTKTPSHPGRAGARGERPARDRRPPPGGRQGADAVRPRGRDRGHRRRRRQRPGRAGRGDRRHARRSVGRDRDRGPRHLAGLAARVDRGRRRAHSRGPPAARPGAATSRWPRTACCTTTTGRRSVARGFLDLDAMRERAASYIQRYDVRGGDPDDARLRAVGWQPAEVHPGARDRLRPAPDPRLAADARPRRRRDRVRAPPAGRAARRRPRPCCSSRSSWTRSSPSPTASS